jgi:cell wall-associated NlpC family hydrolase
VKDVHRGVDVGVPIGTEIHAGQDGTVTFAGYSGDYGNVVVLENDKGLVSKYAHLDSILVSEGQTVQTSDVIAKSGNTGNSTEPHLHLEVLKNGQYLNPILFADTGNTGGFYGNVVYPEYPGEPVSDEMFAAMLEVAQAQLGKQYVWGASGPNYFDCSGLICYVINQSQSGNVGRIGAQSLFNLCTPVQEPQPGDLCFFEGTYDAPHPVTHVGLYVGNGYFIHAGNPVKYSNINSSYYAEHFYAYARLPFGG